jgi:enhancing lycopene biosynthesis protein 2
MAKRVGVLLSGCGRADGSDVVEAVLSMLVIERAGAQAVCAAVDAEQTHVIDHLRGAAEAAPRNARAEAARIVGAGKVLAIGELGLGSIDALIIPGGEGAATILSNYAERRELCQVQPQLAALLRAMLQARRPMGFVGLSALLAARVLGPAAGVRVTLGSKGTLPAKHAAIMGADVRPATAGDVIADEKSRVWTTPGFAVEGAHLPEVARAIDRLVRAVVSKARDRRPVTPAGDRSGGAGDVPEALPVETTGPSRGSA